VHHLFFIPSSSFKHDHPVLSPFTLVQKLFILFNGVYNADIRSIDWEERREKWIVSYDVRIWNVTYIKHCPGIGLGWLKKTVKINSELLVKKAEVWNRYILSVAAVPVCSVLTIFSFSFALKHTQIWGISIMHELCMGTIGKPWNRNTQFLY
jgi:hypothetical protein